LRWAELGTQKKRQYNSTSPHPECLPTPSAKPSTSNVVSTEQKRAVVTMLATREKSVVEVSDVPKNRPLQQRADRDMAVYEGAEREKRLSKSYYD